METQNSTADLFDPNLIKNTASRLKLLRAEKDKTQGEIAKMLSIGQSSYASYEKEKGEGNRISIESLAALSNFYAVSTDFILGLTPIRDKQRYTIMEDVDTNNILYSKIGSIKDITFIPSHGGYVTITAKDILNMDMGLEHFESNYSNGNSDGYLLKIKERYYQELNEEEKQEFIKRFLISTQFHEISVVDYILGIILKNEQAEECIIIDILKKNQPLRCLAFLQDILNDIVKERNEISENFSESFPENNKQEKHD